MDLTNEDVADILALLDSLPYDELDLQTPRFRLTLRRTPAGWTQSAQVHAAPPGAAAAGTMEHGCGSFGVRLWIKRAPSRYVPGYSRT